MAGISDAIRAANEAAAQGKSNIIGNQLDEERIKELKRNLQNSLNVEVLETLNDQFPQQLAANVKTILPTLLDAVVEAQKYDDTAKTTTVNNAFDNALNAIQKLVDTNAFDTDLTNDKDTLTNLQQILNDFNTAVNNSSQYINGNNNRELNEKFKTSKEQLKTTQKDLQSHIEAVDRANAPPEDVSLNTKILKDQLKDAKDNIVDFRQSLSSLFNIHATSNLDETAIIFERINKSAVSADEAIESLHDLFINNKLDTPEAIQGTQDSLNNVKLELESLINDSKQITSNIAQASMGDISNFYTKLLNMGTGADISFSTLQSNLKKLNINESEKTKLEQALNANKQQIDELIKITHTEFTNAFEKKIDDIITSIDKETDNVLNKFASGRGLSNKYTSAFNQAGQTASNIWQIATGIEQTRNRFSIFNMGFGKPNLANIKKDMSVAGQMQFELSNSSNELTNLFDKAIKQKQQGLHKQSEATLEMANNLFASIVNIQSEFNSRCMRAIKKWNSLSKAEQKRLDPEGKMDRAMKDLAQQVKTGNTSLISLRENFNIKIDNRTRKQLEQLRADTKDLTKLEQETKKAEKKTEDTMKQLSNLAREAVNEVRSIVSSIKNIFNSFGNLGIAFAGPFETLRKSYEYYRKQGQLRYAGMGTDAYIGYTDLDDSARRTNARLKAGDELFVRSGGRIDREAIDKQYQSIIRNIGGQYGATPEQTVKDAEILTQQTALLKNVYGVDDSTIQQAIKTYYKDMGMTAEETVDAIATLSTQAQAANVPLGQYLSKVSSLAQNFMQIGLLGEQAGIILNQLLQSGVRMEVAEAVTSQVASAAGKFADDKNKIAFAAAMQGEDPFEALAKAAYTHDAQGNPRAAWGKEMGSYMDTYIKTIMPVAGSDPNMQRHILVNELLKPMGFDQRTASMIASRYIEEGNTDQFAEFFAEQLDKMSNPNKKMEDINEKINAQLEKMVAQLSESDRINAKLDSRLWNEAKRIGSAMDSILEQFAPIILEFQKQMLKFALEALKFIQKMVTSDLFKEITNTIVEMIGKIPDFLSDLGTKLDELVGWVQSIIDGSDKDKNAKRQGEESHMPFDKDTSIPATIGGAIIGSKTPGGIISKIIGGIIGTQILDRGLDTIRDSAAKKDEEGNPIKDENGNIQFEDSLYGNIVEWMSSDERFWNDTSNPLGALVGSLGSSYIFSKLGNIDKLSLTGEASGLAKLGRFNARLALAGLAGYAIQSLFSSDDESNKEKPKETKESSIFNSLYNKVFGDKEFGLSDIFFSKASAATIESEILRKYEEEAEKENETIVAGATMVIDEEAPGSPNTNFMSLHPFLSMPGTTGMFIPMPPKISSLIDTNIPQDNNQTLDQQAPTEKQDKTDIDKLALNQDSHLSTVVGYSLGSAGLIAFIKNLTSTNTETLNNLRKESKANISALFTNFKNLLKAPFADIATSFRTLKDILFEIPTRIINSITGSIKDIGTYLFNTPSSIKDKAKGRTISNWQAAKSQIYFEDQMAKNAKEIEKISRALEKDPNNKTLQNKLASKNVLQNMYKRNYQAAIDIFNTNKAAKWLPKFTSGKDARLLESFFSRIGNYNTNPFEADNNRIKLFQNKLDNINSNLARTEKELQASKSIPSTWFATQDQFRLQQEKFKTEQILKSNKTNLLGKQDLHKKELEKIINSRSTITLTEAEYTQINNLINERTTTQKLLDHSKNRLNELNKLHTKLQQELAKESVGSKRYNHLSRTIERVLKNTELKEKRIAELESKIKITETNLAKQIRNANSFLTRMTRIGFNTTKQLITTTATALSDTLSSIFRLTKESILQIGRSILETLGNILGDDAKRIITKIIDRAKNFISPFKSLFNGLRAIARTLGITSAIGETTKGLSALDRLRALGSKALEKIPGLQKALNMLKSMPEGFKFGAKWIFEKLPLVNAIAAAGSFGIDFVSNLERGADWTTALKVAAGDNLERLVEAAASFGGPAAWAGIAINNILPILHMFGFNVPKKTVASLLGDLIGVHASYTEEEKIAEFSKDLGNKYSILQDNPELLKKVAAGEIKLEQALQMAAMPDLAGMDAEAAARWIEENNNSGNDISDQVKAMISAGILSMEEATKAVGEPDPAKIARVETEKEPESKKEEQQIKPKQYKRKYNEALKELDRVKQLENIPEEEKQKIVQSLINEYTAQVDKEYQQMKEKITTSNLSNEKKVEVLSKLEEEHIKNIENIEKLKDNEIDSETVNKSYIESKKKIEELTGLMVGPITQEQAYENINQRYYTDSIKEAQRILEQTNTFDDTNKNIIKQLTKEQMQRVDKDYQYMQEQIDKSDLDDNKKKELKKQVAKQYALDKKDVEDLNTKIDKAKDVKEIHSLLNEYQNKYDKSRSKIEELTGISFEELPETAYEADKSRKEVADKLSQDITDEQKESQRLQKITNATIEDFMDLHEDLMAALQKSISIDHENIYNMIKVTHKILLDLQQTIARAGALIVSSIGTGSGTGNGTGTPGTPGTNTPGSGSLSGGNVPLQVNEETYKQFQAYANACMDGQQVDPNIVKIMLEECAAANLTVADTIGIFAKAAAESGFNPNAISPVGARGLIQLMPDTAAWLGVTNPFDVRQNVQGAIKFVKYLENEFGYTDPDLNAAAYNAGPGAVKQYGGIPPYSETKKYVENVRYYRNKANGIITVSELGKPQNQPTAGNNPGVLVFGDSVSVMSKKEIEKAIPGVVVDAEGGRNLIPGNNYSSDAMKAWRKRVQQGLPDTVILQLGNETGINTEYFNEILRDVGPNRQLYLTNTFMSNIPEKTRAINAHMAQVAATHPNVHVIDWYSPASQHSDWLVDIVHPSVTGSKGLAQLMSQAVANRQSGLNGAALYALNSGRAVDQGGANPQAVLGVSQARDNLGVFAFGDSIFAPGGAKDDLEAAIPGIVVDARGNRSLGSWQGGLNELQKAINQGYVGNTVIMEMGTNGGLDSGEGEAAIKMLGPNKQIYWANTYNGSNPTVAAHNNAIIQKLANQYSNVHLIDWYGLAKQHPEWFPDGVHPNEAGQRAYAQLVKQSIGARSIDQGGAAMYALNSGRYTDQGGIRPGRYISQFTASYKPGVSCTDAAATMMYNMYKGTDLSIDQFRNQFGTWSMDSVMLNQLGSWSVDITNPNSNDLQQVYNNIQSGKPTLLYYQDRVGANAFTNSGMHAVIALGINSDGSIRIANPNDANFSAIQNVSWDDIKYPLTQGNRLAVYTPNSNPLNIISGQGLNIGSPNQSSPVSAGTVVGNPRYSFWEAYNIIMGAPMGNVGTYQYNPYEGYSTEHLKILAQQHEEERKKIHDRYEKRRLEREKKYGLPSDKKTKEEKDKAEKEKEKEEKDKNKTKAEETETDEDKDTDKDTEDEDKNNKDLTDEEKEKKEKKKRKKQYNKLVEDYINEQKKIQDMILAARTKTIDVEYTYDSDNKLYKERLYKEKYKDELNKLAYYHSDDKKPKYETLADIVPDFYRKEYFKLKDLAKPNPISEKDGIVTIDFENWPEEILSIEEYNKLSDKEKAKYEKFIPVTNITQEEYNKLNDEEKKAYNALYTQQNLYNVNMDNIPKYYEKINGKLSDEEYEKLSQEEKDKYTEENIITEEKWKELDKEKQKEFKEMPQKQLKPITEAEYQQLSEEKKKLYKLTIQGGKNITQEEYNKLSNEEKKQYNVTYQKYDQLTPEEYEKLSDEEKQLYKLYNKWQYTKRPTKRYETISIPEAYDIAEKELQDIILRRSTDQQLFDFYGLTFERDITDKEKKQIAKNLRNKRDLQGNKIDQKELQKLIDEGLSKEEAYQKYLRTHNENENIKIAEQLGNKYQLYDIALTPDFKERSKELDKLPKSILRKKKKTDKANIEVSGYEKGKEVTFWTDKEGALQFYKNQRNLYSAANGIDIQKSTYYKDLYDEAVEKAKKEAKTDKLTELELAQIENNVLKELSGWAEFNMSGREFAEYMGFKIDPNAPDEVYQQMLENVALGVSPSGEPWKDAINDATKIIKDIMKGNFNATTSELKELQDKVLELNSKQTLTDAQIRRLAQQYVLHSDPEKYGMVTYIDKNIGHRKHPYDSWVSPNEPKLHAEPLRPFSIDSYFSGLWGDARGIARGGLNGDELMTMLHGDHKNPTANFTNLFSAQRGTDRLRKALYYDKNRTYGDLSAPGFSAGGKNVDFMNRGQAGLDPNAQVNAQMKRDARRNFGSAARAYSRGDLEYTKYTDERTNMTKFMFKNKAGGKLSITLNSNELTEVAMKTITEALRKYFNECGDISSLFDDILINNK